MPRSICHLIFQPRLIHLYDDRLLAALKLAEQCWALVNLNELKDVLQKTAEKTHIEMSKIEDQGHST